MEIKMLSDKDCLFNGYRYYVSGKYFRRWQDGGWVLLHRSVWEYHKGAIPSGYVVHHIDENKLNNDISNLKMVTYSEHSRIHINKNSISKGVLTKKKLYSEGKIRTNKGLSKTPRYRVICIECGSSRMAYNLSTKFCGHNCKSRHNARKYYHRKVEA